MKILTIFALSAMIWCLIGLYWWPTVCFPLFCVFGVLAVCAYSDIPDVHALHVRQPPFD